MITDERWMRRCLQLARKALGRTAPNPAVGCVIVADDGEVAGEGYHKKAGTAHAEEAALRKAGDAARGATAYTNLEPCNHESERRRKQPCSRLLLEAGVTRVVYGMSDPFDGHGGGGARLRRHGVKVKRGVLRAECEALNRPFAMYATQNRPWFALKAAVSLDGRIATRTGESQWITGAAARKRGHRLRNEIDAIMVGVGTVLADDPRLTVRGVRGGRDPLRVIVDSQLRTAASAAALPAIIATTKQASAARERKLVGAGATVWRVPGRSKRVSLARLATMLSAADITSVLVEGGATLHGGLVDAGLADELALFVAPIMIGGAGPVWLGGKGIAALEDAGRYALDAEPEQVGEDVLLRYVRASPPLPRKRGEG